MGNLAMRGRNPLFVPCTPKGCVELLKRAGDPNGGGLPIAGKKAVVVGRSNIVGMPAALLLLREGATVEIVHSKTVNPGEEIKTADIVIAAVGIPEFVRGDWLKPGCTVIDVGINAVDDATKKRGYRLVGDVNYGEAQGRMTLCKGGGITNRSIVGVPECSSMSINRQLTAKRRRFNVGPFKTYLNVLSCRKT
eukprot:scaffold2030_cov388-Prasinococcus_capsulatus_cf.AAC.4